jgi:RNA-directed DNA polymerase
LSNLVLDDLDKELTQRGHRFCRYADDCNIYVRSGLADDKLRYFEKLAAQRKSLSWLTLRSTSPPKEALLSMSAAASWVAARLAPRAGLVVV